MKTSNSNKEKSILEFLKENRFLTGVGAFVLAALAVMLIAILALNEFIVPVCVLIMIETAMAAFLQKSEMWVHGILVIAQIAAGAMLSRVPLTILCVVVYVAATVTLMFVHKDEKTAE